MEDSFISILGSYIKSFSDSDGDHDFGIAADVDLDATQTSDGVVFTNYRVGPIEDLLR